MSTGVKEEGGGRASGSNKLRGGVDFCFQRNFLCVGPFDAARSEKFDSVICRGVVGRGEHDASVCFEEAHRFCHGRGGDDLGVKEADLMAAQALHEPKPEGFPGSAGVTAQDDVDGLIRVPLAQGFAESEAKAADKAFGQQRSLDAVANPIGAKVAHIT